MHRAVVEARARERALSARLVQDVARLRELVAHAGAATVPPSETLDSSHAAVAQQLVERPSSCGASSASSSSVSSDSRLPRSTAARTSPPTMPCASRNGTPLAHEQVGDVGGGE